MQSNSPNVKKNEHDIENESKMPLKTKLIKKETSSSNNSYECCIKNVSQVENIDILNNDHDENDLISDCCTPVKHEPRSVNLSENLDACINTTPDEIKCEELCEEKPIKNTIDCFSCQLIDKKDEMSDGYKEIDIENWPYEYPEKLIIGNKRSNVGIATLWSLREKVASLLNKDDYCVIANFYDYYNGFEPFVRNCLSNPNIRYLIIVGADFSKSKSVLINFFSFGIVEIADGKNKTWFVKNTNVRIPKEIPIEDVLLLKENVKLIDLTSKISNLGNFEEYQKVINDEIKNLPKLKSYSIGKLFPKKELNSEFFPSSGSLYTVTYDYISDAWLEILFTVKTYGTKTLRAMEELKECICLVSVINKEDPDDPKIGKHLLFDKDDIFKYYETFNYPNSKQGTAYTYGTRLREGNDQFKNLVSVLKNDKNSKRAYATTWVKEDINSKNPPCLISIQPVIQDDVLHMTCYLRSNDMFRAWPLNAFGLRKYQKMFAQELDCEMGPLIIISQSAHVYKENFEQLDLITEHYKKVNCFADIRGYYVIKVDKSKGKIVTAHFSNEGKILKTYSGKTAREISDEINTNAHPSDRYHLSYLSSELTKAEFCLICGIEYVQDSSIESLKKSEM